MSNQGFDWTTEHAVKVGAMLDGDSLDEQQIDHLRDGLVTLVSSVAPDAWAKIGVSEARSGSRSWSAIGKKVILNGD
jgi:hypothetical protein